MNARALSRVGEPVLIEDAMAYAELQADVKALRATNATMLAWLKKIQDIPPEAWLVNAQGSFEPVYQQWATTAIQQVEGIE